MLQADAVQDLPYPRQQQAAPAVLVRLCRTVLRARGPLLQRLGMQRTRDSPMSQRSVHRIEEILPENVYTVEKRGPEIVKRVVHDAVEKDNADNAVPLSTLASLAERGT